MVISKQNLGIFLAITASFIYALYPVGSRGAYEHGVNAVFIILFTTFARALTMSFYCKLKNKKIFENKENTKVAFRNGVIQSISITCILGGMFFISGTILITILFIYPFLLYLLLLFKRQEEFCFTTLLFILLGFVGIALIINSNGQFEDLSPIGLVMAFTAAIFTALRLYVFGEETKKRDPAVIGAEVFWAACLLLSFLMFYQMPVFPTDNKGWMWSFLAAASLSSGSLLMFYGIGLIGSFKYSFFSKLEPIFVALLSFIILQELLNMTQYIGMAIVIGSLILYQILEVKRGKV